MTSAAVAELIREAAREAASTGDLILSSKEPYASAQEFLARHHTLKGLPTLHAQAGTFFRYTGTHFTEVEEQAIRAALWEFAAAAQEWSKPKGRDTEPELVPFLPNIGIISNILEAVKARSYLDPGFQAPCWLCGDELAPAETLVALENGLLDINTRELHTHTPRFFNRNALPFRFDPRKTPEPVLWPRFLNELWPDDPESIDVLQEIFGYLLTTETRQQKAFLIVGPKRSGKGTIARILRALLGDANVCGPTLAGLATNFGLQPLIGKMLAIISDARLSGRTDAAVIAERLLSISGEDAITVDRKHLPSWTGKLPTRFLILSNELPRLADTSGALASRFVVLTLERSFYGKEDPTLTDRLMAELPGIFHWALKGWDRLAERGYFVQPSASRDAIQEMEDLGSPISAFIRDRCEVGPGNEVGCKALYEVWRSWCQSEGRDHAGTAQTFGRDVRAAIPGVRVIQRRDHGLQVRYYEGVGLR